MNGQLSCTWRVRGWETGSGALIAETKNTDNVAGSFSHSVRVLASSTVVAKGSVFVRDVMPGETRGWVCELTWSMAISPDTDLEVSVQTLSNPATRVPPARIGPSKTTAVFATFVTAVVGWIGGWFARDVVEPAGSSHLPATIKAHFITPYPDYYKQLVDGRVRVANTSSYTAYGCQLTLTAYLGNSMRSDADPTRITTLAAHHTKTLPVENAPGLLSAAPQVTDLDVKCSNTANVPVVAIFWNPDGTPHRIAPNVD